MNLNIRSLANAYPVSLFMTLAFLISWGGVFLVGGAGNPGDQAANAKSQLGMGLFMLAGPCISGLLMTWLTEGKTGLRRLFAAMTQWRAGSTWSFSLLIFPIAILSVTVALGRLISPDFLTIFFVPGILIGLLAGFIEETGWTGFALSRMLGRYSVVLTALLLGVIHATWHFPPDYLTNSASLGGYWLPYFLGFSLFVVALRILIVWVYANTHSLLIAQLMHASSTGFLATLVPMDLDPASRAIFYLVYAMTLSIIALSLIALHGRKPQGRRA